MFYKGFCCEEESTWHSVNIIECIASKVSNFCCYVLSRFSLVFFCYAGTLNSIRLDCFHMTSPPLHAVLPKQLKGGHVGDSKQSGGN